ncbi:MAG: hypothetical protein ACM32E_19495 [Gemmatimonadota bacterium]
MTAQFPGGLPADDAYGRPAGPSGFAPPDPHDGGGNHPGYGGAGYPGHAGGGYPGPVPQPAAGGLSPQVTATGTARPPRRALRMTVIAAAGLLCLAAAVAGGLAARAELTRPPTRAELAAAARAAVAQRWQAWPAGRIFPAGLGYTTALLTSERAGRVGIDPAHGCAAALTGALVAAARQDGCLAALRATYADPLQGIVYTTGVLAFPSQARASAFARTAAAGRLPAGLRAFALPGTGSALFTDAARQAAAARHAGPYVVLTVAGYADGRPKNAVGQHRAPVFAPAGQLAADLLRPLAAAPAVRCGQPGWAC